MMLCKNVAVQKCLIAKESLRVKVALVQKSRRANVSHCKSDPFPLKVDACAHVVRKAVRERVKRDPKSSTKKIAYPMKAIVKKKLQHLTDHQQ